MAGWVGLALIVTLSLLPGSKRPHNLLGLSGQYEHLLAYLLTAGALGLRCGKTRSRGALLILLVTCAALLETAQILIPNRTAQLVDFSASSIGAGGGLLAAAVFDCLVPPSLNGKADGEGSEAEPAT